MTKNPYKNLKLWNGIMAGLHAIQGIAMVSLTKSDSLKQIFISLPKPNPEQRSFGNVVENWYQVNLGYVIASFLFLSAFAHLITILPKVYEWYINNLKNQLNLIRWFEYALSSSVMVYVIAYLCGISDGLMLFVLVSINACMNLFGASMELHNSNLKKQAKPQKIIQTVMQGDEIFSSFKIDTTSYKTEWSNFVYGCFAGIVPWIVMGTYFFVSLDRLGNIDTLPDNVKNALKTVKFIFPALFIFFNCFAINMVLQYKKLGPWKNYLTGEKVYIILSLTAKSFLAWFIWGGTLRP